MKAFLPIILFVCATNTLVAQFSVSGTIKHNNNHPVYGQKVHIVPDTSSLGIFYFFQSITTTTNSAGQYTFNLPQNMPNNAGFKVHTNDCNLITKASKHMYIGTNTISNFVICSSFPVPGLQGHVRYSKPPQNSAVDGVVYLIEQCLSNNTYTLTLIDSALTNTTGYYSFSKYPQLSTNCDLLLKASLRTTSINYKSYMPSYHITSQNSSLLWSGASKITTAIASQNVDILLLSGNNQGGPGFIGGQVLQGANKGTAVGDPLPFRILILTDSNDKPIEYTYSDNNGKFEFKTPYGSYKVFGDALGKSNPALTLKIDANKSNIPNIIFRENSNTFKGQFVTDIPTIRNSAVGEVRVFPNPVKDKISVKGLKSAEGIKVITLSSLSGSIVYKREIIDIDNIAIQTRDLPNGLYILQLQTEIDISSFKITKQD